MPALMWIAFWSSMIGAAACWQEAALPDRRKEQGERRDEAAGEPSTP